MSLLGFVSRRPLLSLGALAGLWWMWPDSPATPGATPGAAPGAAPEAAPAGVQAAVLADGFAASDGARRIVDLDADAHRRRELEVTGVPAGAYVVGLGGHIGLVWRDGRRIAVGLVEDDGRVERVQRFGSRVTAMCAGVATNEHRSGVAWFEASGGVWFVGGPTARRAAGAPAGAPLAAISLEVPGFDPAKADVCAIASAGEQVALLWTEGSRTQLALCGRQCASPRRVVLPRKTAVLGLGCTDAGCAIVTRAEGGVTQATWIKPDGKAQWTHPLPHASPGTQVALAGTRSRIAIAYATANEPVVVAATPAGELATVWQGASDGLPSIVPAGDRLLVARSVDGEVTASLVRAP